VIAILSLASTTLAVQPKWWNLLGVRGDRDRFWKHHVQNKTLVLEGVDYYEPIEACLTWKLTPEGRDEIKTAKTNTRKVLKKLKEPVTKHTYLVSVENAISQVHVNAVRTLAACVREVIPKLYEVRAMYLEQELEFDPGLGGNCPTHLAPIIGIFFPEVVAEMQKTLTFAYDAAGWADWHMDTGVHPKRSLPSPDMVGFRASEHLTYNEFKEGLNNHNDGGDTYYTMNYAFMGPDEYDGGFFYIINRNKQKIFLKPPKNGALIFLGGIYIHGVTQIHGGVREMFSSEMWAYPDTPFGSSLWNNSAVRFEEYIKLCNKEREVGAVGPCMQNLTEIDIKEDHFVNFNFERHYDPRNDPDLFQEDIYNEKNWDWEDEGGQDEYNEEDWDWEEEGGQHNHQLWEGEDWEDDEEDWEEEDGEEEDEGYFGEGKEQYGLPHEEQASGGYTYRGEHIGRGNEL